MPATSQRPRIAETAAAAGGTRPCDWPGCAGQGQHRAPRSRQALTDYLWYCLEHVRQYNAAWNYFAGMTEVEVEADVRLDTVWQRPTWPLAGGAHACGLGARRFDDAFGVFGDAATEARRPPASTPEEKAMIVLDLRPPLDPKTVKKRYKALVKRHHPDANGGDKGAEEKFKQINDAYRTIMASLGT